MYLKVSNLEAENSCEPLYKMKVYVNVSIISKAY